MIQPQSSRVLRPQEAQPWCLGGVRLCDLQSHSHPSGVHQGKVQLRWPQSLVPLLALHVHLD